jgi:hypothetical protein
MYERMTIQARWLVQRALADARRLAHRRMGSEHLLLALVAAEGPTAMLFHARGATPERVEEEVTRLAAEPEGIEADGERHVGLEHVGLALLARSGDGVAEVLDRLGVRSDELAGAIVDRYPPRRQPRRVWSGRPRGGR